jgi:hypothetical protein
MIRCHKKQNNKLTTELLLTGGSISVHIPLHSMFSSKEIICEMLFSYSVREHPPQKSLDINGPILYAEIINSDSQ